MSWSFPEEIIKHSENNTWHLAKEEWKLSWIDWANLQDGEHCLCGHPICELCYISNKFNNNTLLVGNVCVNNFLEIPSNLIFASSKRVLKDISKSFNAYTLEYCFDKNFINAWEFNFLLDTMSKRKLSDKQLFKRKDINKKIINKFKQTSKAA